MRDAARRDEERLRRETEDGLSRFRAARRGQELESRASGAQAEVLEQAEVETEGLGWDVPGGGRKRKREGGGALSAAGGRLVKGVVKRRASTAEEESDTKGQGDAPSGSGESGAVKGGAAAGAEAPAAKDSGTKSAVAPPKPKGGLVAYDSDDSDSDED